tara:strand:- start:72 stop:278 length:207 start_codon:yes stop_codon:yes gene_type:complete
MDGTEVAGFDQTYAQQMEESENEAQTYENANNEYAEVSAAAEEYVIVYHLLYFVHVSICMHLYLYIYI